MLEDVAAGLAAIRESPIDAGKRVMRQARASPRRVYRVLVLSKQYAPPPGVTHGAEIDRIQINVAQAKGAGYGSYSHGGERCEILAGSVHAAAA